MKKSNKTAAPKKGLGAVITRKRREAAAAIDQERERFKQKERQAALDELARAKDRLNRDAVVQDDAVYKNNLLRTVASNQVAVMRSFGLTQNADVQMAQSGYRGASSLVAYTDFKSVVVRWPKEKLPSPVEPRDRILDTIAAIKGVMQHEVGHLRFTVPAPDLFAAAGQPLSNGDTMLHMAWNCLEDQRMETLVVKSVPRIANYFTSLAISFLMEKVEKEGVPIDLSWIILAGREYLPQALRVQSKVEFDNFTQREGLGLISDEWHTIVNEYKSATTPQDMVDAVKKAKNFMERVYKTLPQTSPIGGQMQSAMDSVDDHDQMSQGAMSGKSAAKVKKQVKQTAIADSDMEEVKEKAEKAKANAEKRLTDETGGRSDFSPGEGEDGRALAEKMKAEQGEGEGDEGEGEGDGDGEGDGEGEKKPEVREVSQSDHGGGTPDWEDALNQARQNAIILVRKDRDVNEMANNTFSSTDREGLPDFPHTNPFMEPHVQMQALATSNYIRAALESFVTANAPVWRSRTEQGVIDALAFRTKEVGDMDFRRSFEDKGQNGLDVHVSVLADNSGSMSTNMVALSQFLYATGLACQELGIKFTFTLWSSDNYNYRVWADGEPVPEVFPAMGGTDPTKALDDLDTHNQEGAKHHLVMVFTDGMWNAGFPSLTRWSGEGRRILFVNYLGGYYDSGNQKDMGADYHININSLDELPHHLTTNLLDILGGE